MRALDFATALVLLLFPAVAVDVAKSGGGGDATGAARRAGAAAAARTALKKSHAARQAVTERADGAARRAATAAANRAAKKKQYEAELRLSPQEAAFENRYKVCYESCIAGTSYSVEAAGKCRTKCMEETPEYKDIMRKKYTLAHEGARKQSVTPEQAVAEARATKEKNKVLDPVQLTDQEAEIEQNARQCESQCISILPEAHPSKFSKLTDMEKDRRKAKHLECRSQCMELYPDFRSILQKKAAEAIKIKERRFHGR